jgi:hypothetical protein
VSLRRRLRFSNWSVGNWSALEEVVTQGSFKIGYKLAHGSGAPDGLKFGFGVFRLGRGMLDRRLGFMRDGPGKKVFAQGRFQIRDELLKDGRRGLGGRLSCDRFGASGRDRKSVV